MNINRNPTPLTLSDALLKNVGVSAKRPSHLFPSHQAFHFNKETLSMLNNNRNAFFNTVKATSNLNTQFMVAKKSKFYKYHKYVF